MFVLHWDVAEIQSWFTLELILVQYRYFRYQKKSSSRLSAIHQNFFRYQKLKLHNSNTDKNHASGLIHQTFIH